MRNPARPVARRLRKEKLEWTGEAQTQIGFLGRGRGGWGAGGPPPAVEAEGRSGCFLSLEDGLGENSFEERVIGSRTKGERIFRRVEEAGGFENCEKN